MPPWCGSDGDGTSKIKGECIDTTGVKVII
jgi:hypothetical protein